MPLQHEEEGAPVADEARNAARAIWAELDAEEAAGVAPAGDEPAAEAPAATGSEPAPRQDEQQQAAPIERSPTGTALSDEERALLRQIPDVVQLVKATVGRVGSIQSQLAHMGKVAATQQGAGEKPSQQQITNASASPEKWEGLKKDFPDWAEGVEALLSARIPSAPPAVDPQALARHVEGQIAQRLQSQREEDAMEVVSSFDADWKAKAGSEEFAKWIGAQPAEYRDRALASWKPSEILRTMRDFDAASRPAPTHQPNPRLAKSVLPRAASRVSLTKPVEEMTQAEYWAYLDAQEAKNARAA